MVTLDLTTLHFQSAPFRAKQFMDSQMIDIAIREILDPLKTAYISKGAAQSYIDEWEFLKTGYLTMSLDNNHRFAQWLEYGTEPHEITPAEKEMLYWTDSNGEHFRFLVQHPGFGGYRIIPHLLAGLVNRFIIVLVKRTNEFLLRSQIP